MRSAPRSVVVLVVCLLAAAAGALAAAESASAAGAPAAASSAQARGKAASGSVVWTRTLNATSGRDGLRVCAPGPRGSLYAAGVASHPDGADFLLARYSSSGRLLWKRTWNGPEAGLDSLEDLVVDGAGNAYVCGSARRTSNDYGGEYVVLKYDARGKLKWAVTRYFGEVNNAPQADAIGLDADGDVYVSGLVDSPVFVRSDVFTAKLDRRNGRGVWTSVWPGDGFNRVADLFVTRAGVCYTCGDTGGNIADSGGEDQAVLLKTSAAGRHLRAETWGAAAGMPDVWERVEPAAGGGVVVAGTSAIGGGAYELTVARYASTGRQVWLQALFEGAGVGLATSDLAVAQDGSVWVCGVRDWASETDAAGVVARWSAAGRRVFVKSLGVSGAPVSLASILTDAAGNAFVCGSARQASGARRGLVARYTPGGGRRWTRYVAAGTAADDYLTAVCRGREGGVYAVGTADAGVAAKGLAVRLRR